MPTYAPNRGISAYESMNRVADEAAARRYVEELRWRAAPRLPDTAKSPLRYPGGKTRAVPTICGLIPPGTAKLCSPFLGGGSIELACAAAGMRVYGSDAFAPLVNFWRHALDNPARLSRVVGRHYPLSKEKFYNLQKNYSDLNDDLKKAAVFFVLNRASFSGTTLSGGMSPGHPRFTLSAIERLRDFRAGNLRVNCADYRKAIARHPDAFLYLDPPYANGERLYGTRGDMHEGFNHEELADVLRGRDGWILSYDNSPRIRKLYRGYTQKTPTWTYGMAGDKTSRELLILNV